MLLAADGEGRTSTQHVVSIVGGNPQAALKSKVDGRQRQINGGDVMLRMDAEGVEVRLVTIEKCDSVI